jgi:uncharacterized protein (TIGR03382 family)
MKCITVLLAAVALLSVPPAHADTYHISWQSEAWVKTYETPSQAVVNGPFTLSGTGTATFAEIAGGGATFTFADKYGGTLVANGDGSYNGPMAFPTANNETRNGLGVLRPSADGFTVTVGRAASGPDAGASFVGTGTRVSGATRAAVAASEPMTIALAVAGLTAAGVLRRRRG